MALPAVDRADRVPELVPCRKDAETRRHESGRPRRSGHGVAGNGDRPARPCDEAADGIAPDDASRCHCHASRRAETVHGMVAQRALVYGNRPNAPHHARRGQVENPRCQTDAERATGSHAPGGRRMITKSELQTAYREQHAERAASEPPTAEEVLAYVQGELSGDEEARVHERLLAHPDMLRAAIAPFPSDDARPGHADYLPDDQVAKQWRGFPAAPFPVPTCRRVALAHSPGAAARIAFALGVPLLATRCTRP